MYYIYIVRCNDGTYYTGFAVDVEKRVAVHNKKQGAKYTKPRTPVTLVYTEEFPTKGEALKREAAIKKLTRKQKDALIEKGKSCKEKR